MYYEPDFCSKHLGFFSEETFQKFPDLCWNIVLRQNLLAASSQPRKLHSQFSHILLWIPGSDRERKRGSTAIFFPRKKDGNIVLQHLKTCTQGQPEEKNWKGTQTLTSFEIFFFFFPQMFELMKVLLFYPHEFSTNKISWQIKSYANTGQFFLCFNSKNTVGQEENRIFLTYYPQLKDRSIFGMDQAWSNFNNNTRPSTITQVHKFLFCFFNKTTT